MALNELAKSVGIKKFEPYFKQQTLINRNKVQVFSSNYALYGNISERIMATLREHTPTVEVYSIDEGFCDLTGIATHDLKPLADKLRAAVWREQRIPMGVSIAPTKTLAKLGQYATKVYPQINGVAVLVEPQQWEWLARRVTVSEVWGVGGRLTIKLGVQDVNTAYELSQLNLETARKIGGVTLVRTVRELNGQHCIPFELVPPSKQSIVCSRSFGKKTNNIDALLEAVTAFAYRAAEKLRRQGSLAGHLTVRVVKGQSYGASSSVSLSTQLTGGTDDARFIAKASTGLTRELYRPDTTYMKAGVELFDVRPAECWSQDLWSPCSMNDKTMETLDKVNRKYGRNTIGLGRMIGSQDHAMRTEFLSPQYLTRWSDLPSLAC